MTEIVFSHEADRAARRKVAEIEADMGLRIAGLRKAIGLSQQGLAPAIGADSSTITRVEKGQRSLRYGEAVLLLEALGVSIDGAALICSACVGAPPSGFTCNTCGAGGAS